jgi:acetoin utilization deacetylase AcuC-like enzyme
MLIFHSPAAEKHDPQTFFRHGKTVPHPESAERYRTLRQAIGGSKHVILECGDAGLDPINAVHDQGYVAFLADAWGMSQAADPAATEVNTTQFARTPPLNRPTNLQGLMSYYSSDTSSGIRAGTWEAVYASAQTAISAADALATERAAYALCRPPGHHAHAIHSSGFCYLNNAAIAVERLASRFGKVATLDIDVHHGDGTQDIFYRRSDILTVSTHAETFDYFPYFTGYENERGVAEGEGYNHNLPLPRGSGDQAYLEAIESGLERIAKHDAAVLVVSLGLDAAEADPVGILNVSTDGFRSAASLISNFGLPTLLVQEGGYPCDALGVNLAAFLEAFESP